MSRIIYQLIAALARLAFRSGRSKDLEIIVLRHQLAVLRRQIDRPKITDHDRILLGAIAAALPRPRRTGWLVTPDTLLRWHRRRVARHWTQPNLRPGSQDRPDNIGRDRGHGFIQNLRRGHYELGADTRNEHLRVAAAFDVLTETI